MVLDCRIWPYYVVPDVNSDTVDALLPKLIVPVKLFARLIPALAPITVANACVPTVIPPADTVKPLFAVIVCWIALPKIEEVPDILDKVTYILDNAFAVYLVVKDCDVGAVPGASERRFATCTIMLIIDRSH